MQMMLCIGRTQTPSHYMNQFDKIVGGRPAWVLLCPECQTMVNGVTSTHMQIQNILIWDVEYISEEIHHRYH
eukprot:1706128-Pyramimonas_sp.AAC.2